MRFYCGPRLLVIDEFAYSRTAPDPDANAALFEVINRRYLKSSTIVTSHAGVASWGADSSGRTRAAVVSLAKGRTRPGVPWGRFQ